MARPGVGHDAQVMRRVDQSRSTVSVLFCAGFILAQLACSASNGDGSSIGSLGTGATTSTGSGGKPGVGAHSGTTGIMLGEVGGMTVADGGTGGAKAVTTLPEGFHATDIGGYKLGERVTEGAGGTFGGGGTFGAAAGSGGAAGGGGGPVGDCGNILLGVVRDFKGADEGGHPDFETAKIYGGDVTPNMVAMALGADRKPVYASKCEIANPGGMAVCPFGAQNTNQAAFEQWYHNTPGVNDPYTVSIFLAPRPGGIFTFQSLAYFPIDGAGFMGSKMADDGMNHNFGFTTELHTQFLYSGGETFNFQGDDDVWVFINNKLAVDVGGLHPMQQRNVDLDASAAALGITKGTIYPLDLFHAERHTSASTFRIDTNLSFTDCGTVIPDKVK